MSKYKNKKIYIPVITLMLFILFIVIAIPLPFKPSVWTYMHRKRLDRNLATYTAPVYLPPQSDKSGVGFDTFINWKDSYLIRGFSDNKNHTGGQSYYQLAKLGFYPATPEGPSESDMQPYADAMTMECDQHSTGIEVCIVGDPKYYIARYDVGDAYLLRNITVLKLNKDKLELTKYDKPFDYFPPSEDDISAIATLLKSTQPVPINEARKYFKPEF